MTNASELEPDHPERSAAPVRRRKSKSTSIALSDADRIQLMRNHPVFKRKFTFPTPPVRRAFDIVAKVVATGASGCSFAAYPRFGKSCATDYLKEKLIEAFPGLLVVQFNAHDDARNTPNQFFADLLEQSRFAGGIPERRAHMRERTVRAWWVTATSNQSDTIVLLGDEMQHLRPNEFTWIIDLMNDLHKMDVRVIGVFFGQPELAHLRTLLKQTHRGDILGRFMSRFYSFHGIAGAAELSEVMMCYDDPSQGAYPANSGCCFTRFFLPNAYDHGWRLASCASDLWECFREGAVPRLSAPNQVEKLMVGMEWVAGAIQEMFARFTDFDAPHFRLSLEHWRDAVNNCTFLDQLGLTYEPD